MSPLKVKPEINIWITGLSSPITKGTAIDTPTNAMNRLSALLTIGKVSLINKIKSPYISIARIPIPASRRYWNLPSASFTDTLG